MAQTVPLSTYAQYLAHEEAAELKHEFVNGRILAMSGGTIAHAALASRILGQLTVAMAGRRCEAYGSDLRVRVSATERTTYPDVTVVCGNVESDPVDKNAVTNPVVLGSVLSESTEPSDRGEKFAHYRRIPSLRHYLLVSQSKRLVELFTRGDDGNHWDYEAVEGTGGVKLRAIGCELTLDALYADRLAGA